MPRPFTGNIALHARITPSEIALVECHMRRRKLTSLSMVVDQALQQLIERTDCGRKGLTIQPIVEGMVSRKYYVSPDVHRQLAQMSRAVGFNTQQILRAALALLDRDGHDPTHKGR